MIRPCGGKASFGRCAHGGLQLNAAGLFTAGAVAGFLAGGLSCAAAQAGLLAGAVRADRAGRSLGVFLAAKLGAHTALGALLGAAGAAVQPGPRVRAVLLLLAVVPLTVFALELFGLRILRSRAAPCESGASGHGSGRTHRPIWRAALPGVATVLVPCGVTLAIEMVAVASRSPLGGAMALGGFVIGTMPLFGLLGAAIGRSLTAARGRLTPFVGLLLLAVAGWTLLSGLRLGGWLPADASVASIDTRFVRTDELGTQTITVWALNGGYRPAVLSARAAVPTVLVLRTARTTGCTRVFVLPSRGLQRVLPVTGDTRIALGSPRPGRLRFVCAAGHYPGGITFR